MFSNKDRYLAAICTKSCVQYQYLCFPCSTVEVFRNKSLLPVKVVFE